MQFKSVLAIATFSVCIMLSACNNEDSSAVTQNNQDQKLKLQPIVIQGALPVESERMASKLDQTSARVRVRETKEKTMVKNI